MVRVTEALVLRITVLKRLRLPSFGLASGISKPNDSSSHRLQ